MTVIAARFAGLAATALLLLAALGASDADLQASARIVLVTAVVGLLAPLFWPGRGATVRTTTARIIAWSLASAVLAAAVAMLTGLGVDRLPRATTALAVLFLALVTVHAVAAFVEGLLQRRAAGSEAAREGAAWIATAALVTLGAAPVWLGPAAELALAGSPAGSGRGRGGCAGGRLGLFPGARAAADLLPGVGRPGPSGAADEEFHALDARRSAGLHRLPRTAKQHPATIAAAGGCGRPETAPRTGMGTAGILLRPDRLPLCIKCGQCMAICPSQSITVDGMVYSRDFFAQLAGPVTEMPFLEMIKTRRAIRVFKDQPVPRELLEKVVQAIAFAPPGFPPVKTEVVVVQDKSVMRQALPEMIKVYEA